MKCINIFFKIAIVGLLSLSVFSASAQTCVVGGTNFDTNAILFDPEMTNDATATGWYNEDVGDVLDDLCIDCQYYTQVENGIHQGVLSNAMSSGGALFSEALWATIMTNGNNVGGSLGGSAIVANPKLIDPRLKEYHNNMFVNAGATHEKPFFSYTATGLAPNSPVTITLDVYNLLDLESAEEYSKAKGGGNFSIGGYNYDANNKAYYGNTGIGITGSTVLNNGAVSGGTSTGTIDFGASKTLTINATTDAGGTVTFYFGRPGGINFAPIGIDNIKVTGTLKPKVVSQKVLPVCVANPVLLRPSSAYPAGTTYSWTTTPPSVSGTAQQFAFTPANLQNYTINLSVTIPGCAAAVATPFILEVKECCTGPAGVPMAETYIFYDDFGEFAGSNSYQYRAADGSLQPGSVAGLFAFNENPPVATKPPGFTSAYTYWSDAPNQHERALIIPWFPYTSPRFYDNTSSNGTNGMLFFGLGSAGNMNKVLYQRKICDLCPGKEIKFGASYSAANTNAGGVFEVELRLMEGDYEASLGAQLASSGTQVLTKPEWKGFETTFTVTDPSMTCVTLQVISKKDDYNGMNIGDLALDDIYASVCTPPDVSVSASLSGSAPDILNLCTGTSFTLQAETSTAITTFYGGNPAYLFQYSFDNPSTEANPTWFDLGTIGAITSQTITDPKNHPAFNYETGPGAGKDKTYFRIVVGEQSYLSGSRAIWETMDALSPCRAVSISAIPVEASVNCPCLTPNSIKIDATKPIAGKMLTLCMDETATLSLLQGTSPNYETQWFKQNTQPLPADTYESNTPTYSITATEAGTTVYWVKAVETLEDREECRRFDKITVQVNISPAENVDGKTACVAVPKTPASGDEICFQFISNYAKGTYTGS
ncbi:MAG: hypothetical protein LBR55_02160, partial [Bacteroidales bacterium]|nr:hypothetical protein [Bacteroidales bacterium]